MNKIVTYLRNSRAELKRVTWPTRTEVIESTQATLIFVFITAIFLLITDSTLGFVISRLIP
ncbi:MAG: preprotein translocase subunit SecE [Deinococcota bacterium]|nr:preprotein translocase subunit SecE [Deinococcota bacterium]